MSNHLGKATDMVHPFIAILKKWCVFAAGMSFLSMAAAAVETSFLLCLLLTFVGAILLNIDADARTERAREEGFRDAMLALTIDGDVTFTVARSTAAPKPEVRE